MNIPQPHAHVQPTPLEVGSDAAVHLARVILDKTGDVLAQVGAGLAAGALIGFVGSALSVGRHLKQVWREEG